ncbi:phage tail tape measure protein [Aquabacterium sp.]|uniref:phage tail tape measure protein n=1 Tax=Aquabacterium sp. TaxID=1872578 RepID=UPI003BB1DC26
MATKQLKAIVTLGGAFSSSLGSAFRRTSSGFDDVSKAMRKAKDEQAKLSRQIAEATRNGPAQVGHLTAAYAKLGTQIDQLRGKQAKLQAQEAAAAKRQHLRGKLGVGMAATAAIGAGQGAAIGSAFGRSADFNYGLAGIGVTANMTQGAVKSLSTEIINLGRETNQGAVKVKDAFSFLVAASGDIEQSKAALKGIGVTATAASAEIEDVARASFTLMNTLKVKPDQLKDTLEILVAAGKAGNFEFKDMAGNLPKLGASFASLKMEGKEATATIGAALQIVRKDAGSSEQAADYLQNLMSKLLSPETLKRSEKLGMNLHKVIQKAWADGKNPFEAGVEAISKMTSQADLKLLGELFGDMEVQYAVKPLVREWEKYKEIKKEALSTKSIDRDFGIMSATARVQIDKLKDSAFGLSVRLGTALEPTLVALGNTLTPLVQSLSDWTAKNPELASSIVIGGAALTAFTAGALALGFAATFLKPGLVALSAGFRLAGGAIMFAGKSLLWVGRALLMNPIGLAVTAIAGAVFLIYKYWEPLTGFFTNLWAGIKASGMAVFDWVASKLAWVGDAYRKVKGWFSSDAPAASTPAASRAPVSLPPMARGAAGAGAAGTVNNNQKVSVVVNAAPGQSPTQVGKSVAKEVGKSAGLGSGMYDAPAY